MKNTPKSPILIASNSVSWKRRRGCNRSKLTSPFVRSRYLYLLKRNTFVARFLLHFNSTLNSVLNSVNTGNNTSIKITCYLTTYRRIIKIPVIFKIKHKWDLFKRGRNVKKLIITIKEKYQNEIPSFGSSSAEQKHTTECYAAIVGTSFSFQWGLVQTNQSVSPKQINLIFSP